MPYVTNYDTENHTPLLVMNAKQVVAKGVFKKSRMGRRAGAYIRLARPQQYVKNGLLFLPLFFGHRMGDMDALWHTGGAFLCFCLASSGIYILNDILDVEYDRKHPIKRLRPIAAGEISIRSGVSVLILVLLVSLIMGMAFVGRIYVFILGGYILMNILYCFKIKHIAILDVVSVAVGFVFRIFAGGVAAGVNLSHWIVLMTFILALFLSLAKRRDDLLLKIQGRDARQSADGYSLDFVSVSMSIMAAVTIVSYILYTVSPEVIALHGSDKIYLTTFWVILGILRYLQITFVLNKSGSPTTVLIQDAFMLLIILFWILNFAILLYL